MSVTAATGFRAAAVSAGLKAAGALDVALVVNDGPRAAAAAVFTRNRVRAAPVLWSQQAVADGRAGAVILNSGGANACTGPDGFADTHAIVEAVAARIGIDAGDVLACSTGLIGTRLPVPSVLAAVPHLTAGLADGEADARRAADAIRTTDSVTKQAAVSGSGWTVGGMAKGAGMLAPSLATMLCVLTTDADVDSGLLDATLRRVVARTFDRLDADGCQSTNDTVTLFASGASGVRPDPFEFESALLAVCRRLARQLLADAEGATKEIAIHVGGAMSVADAVEVGRAIARNNLFKCAIFGHDPNWGRVVAAIGTTQAEFDPLRLDVSVNDVWVCRDTAPAADPAAVDLTGRDVTIGVDLHAGAASATVWTTDLSHAYVEENSVYST